MRICNWQIGALIHDLGLSPVRHSRVATLTLSERCRLNVACHLLLDTDVVLLDQPTQGMDIFDTFFLVEYLRQWAERGRIVILSIHPPTYEIFTMLSRVALISSGRLMYSGRRREMLPYFAFIEFPCPAYKNPSDYYRTLPNILIIIITSSNIHNSTCETNQSQELASTQFYYVNVTQFHYVQFRFHWMMLVEKLDSMEWWHVHCMVSIILYQQILLNVDLSGPGDPGWFDGRGIAGVEPASRTFGGDIPTSTGTTLRSGTARNVTAEE